MPAKDFLELFKKSCEQGKFTKSEENFVKQRIINSKIGQQR
jgi:hypothetical protein